MERTANWTVGRSVGCVQGTVSGLFSIKTGLKSGMKSGPMHNYTCYSLKLRCGMEKDTAGYGLAIASGTFGLGLNGSLNSGLWRGNVGWVRSNGIWYSNPNNIAQLTHHSGLSIMGIEKSLFKVSILVRVVIVGRYVINWLPEDGIN